jgi:predicted small lipoprotein YifL
MKKVFGVMIVLLLAVSFLAACGPGEPAEFTLSSVTVSPSAPEVGDTVTISATVTNVGEQSGDCAVSLTVDGSTDSKSVSALAGGASSSVSFTYDATAVGSYTAELSTPDDSKSKSFTVSEEGAPPVEGVPTWSVGDYWVLDCSYTNPGGKVEEDAGQLTVTVTGEEALDGEVCYTSAGVFEPGALREAADMPLALTIETADIWTSKDKLVYMKMSSSIAELPGIPSTVAWTLAGDYGYPFEGKTWSGSVHVVAGVIDEITDLEFEVLGEESVTVPAGTFDCWHIVVSESGSPGTYVNEYWINTTEVKSVVKEIERSLWKGEEVRELSSYSVS